jgi:hypothetical protein
MRPLNPVGADRQRHVYPVVDEEPGAVSPGEVTKRPGQAQQFHGREILLPDLNGLEPCPQALLHYFVERPAERLGSVSYQIE